MREMRHAKDERVRRHLQRGLQHGPGGVLFQTPGEGFVTRRPGEVAALPSRRSAALLDGGQQVHARPEQRVIPSHQDRATCSPTSTPS